MQAVSFLTESWILKSSETECTEQNWLHQLLRSLVMKELHMVNLSLCYKLVASFK